MLEHLPQSQANYHQLLPDEQFLQSVDNPTGSELEQKIEDYLDHAYAPLVGTLPYAKRQEIRAEMKQHLVQIIAAHQELGDNQDEAIEASLRQFGHPEKLTKSFLKSIHEIEPIKWYEKSSVKPTFWHSVTTLGSSLILYFFFLFLLPKLNLAHEFLIIITLSAGLTIPFLTGVSIGKSYRHRPVLGMLLAQSLILPCWIFPSTFIHDLLLTETSQYDPKMWLVGFFAYILLAPTGCLGARIGRFLKTRRKRIASVQ